MNLYLRKILCASIIISLLLVGCGSEEPKEDVTKQTKIASNDENLEKVNSDITSASKIATSIPPDSPLATDVNQTSRDIVPQIPPSIPQIQTNTLLEISPTLAEPIGDPTIGLSDDTGDNDQKWNNLRKMYISQYIQNPKSIIWGLNHPLAKNTYNFLEKGYWSYWPPKDENSEAGKATFSRLSTKEIELGFLAARNKIEPSLEEYLKTLEQQGGKDYAILAYITSWYYCSVGKNDIAKNLISKSNLLAQVAMFAIPIPAEHLAALQIKVQEPPTFVAPQIPIPTPPTTTPQSSPPAEGNQPPAEGNQPPAEGNQPPVEGNQPPVEGNQPPVEGEQPPVEGEQPPVEGEQPPVEGEQPPVEGEQPPVEGEQPPVEGE